MNDQVSVIVPAHNEAQTIGAVLGVVKQSPLVAEIIVVSDGSTDDTVACVKRLGIQVIDLHENMGKGGAMLEGLAHATGSIILFLDADLIGLTVDHVDRIVRPVLWGKVVMSVGIRDHGSFWNRLAPRFPLISGQRAVRREVSEGVPRRFYDGFMIEAALNYFCRSHRLPYGSVSLPGLTVRQKHQKVGWPKAVVQYGAMTTQVLWSMVRVRLARITRNF